MFRFSVKHDLDRMISTLNDIQRRRVPIATAIALTRTAVENIKPGEIEKLKAVIGRPTRWTLNAVFVKPATRQNLRALVWLKDEAFKGTPAATYLAPQVYGGARVQKRFERAMQHTGVLPKGMFALPGAAAKLDQYGNMSSGQIVQILSQLRAQRSAGYESRIGGATADRKKIARAVKRQGYRIFAITKPRGKLVPGVWARYEFAGGKSAVKPLLIFVKDAPRYRKLVPFFEEAQRIAIANFPRQFDRAMRELTSR